LHCLHTRITYKHCTNKRMFAPRLLRNKVWLNRSQWKISLQIWREPSLFVSSIIYCINTVNTQHIRRPYVLVQLGYIWRHVSAVKRPSSGQQRIVLLRYVKFFVQWDPIVHIKTWNIMKFLIMITIFNLNNFTIFKLNILIITKNFIMFQVLM